VKSNDTLLAYSGEQLRSGVPSDDVIKDCLARVHKAYDEIPGDPQERPIWDWTKIRHQIEAMVFGYIEKKSPRRTTHHRDAFAGNAGKVAED
jgi:hypothetical protein